MLLIESCTLDISSKYKLFSEQSFFIAEINMTLPFIVKQE